MNLTLKNITKSYGDISALRDVTLEIKEGEFVSILGENGSGKTTLLKVLAGIVSQNSGHIYFDDMCVDDVSANKRKCIMVWQGRYLFPHLNVHDNIAFGLKINKVPRFEQEKIITSMVQLLGLESKMYADISELSGGQAQRVALARALVMQPRILLLDEPFSALDPQASKQLREEIIKLRETLDLTIVMVTHSVHDALLMSDKVMILRSGMLEQIGTPFELYKKPKNEYVLNFFDRVNFLENLVEKSN